MYRDQRQSEPSGDNELTLVHLGRSSPDSSIPGTLCGLQRAQHSRGPPREICRHRDRLRISRRWIARPFILFVRSSVMTCRRAVTVPRTSASRSIWRLCAAIRRSTPVVNLNLRYSKRMTLTGFILDSALYDRLSASDCRSPALHRARGGTPPE